MAVAENKQLIVTRKGSYYTQEDKQFAALMYLQYGNMVKVSSVTQIPQTTLSGWIKTDWWENLLVIVRAEKKDELNANLTRLIDKSVQVIEKQLENNEVKAIDAAKIMGISFDKRQILNHEPTSITSSSKISDLQQQFETYMKAKDITADVIRTNSELDNQ